MQAGGQALQLRQQFAQFFFRLRAPLRGPVATAGKVAVQRPPNGGETWACLGIGITHALSYRPQGSSNVAPQPELALMLPGVENQVSASTRPPRPGKHTVKNPMLIHAADIAPQRWRNGGGWTRELLTWPAGNPDWQLRISLATIEAAGPFSAFPGVQRVLTVVAGAGVLLTVQDREHRLTPGSVPLHFDGGATAHAAPIAGATTDLNLMVKHGHGDLLRVEHGAPWVSRCTQRGLFTAVDGTVYVDVNPPLRLPAHTLLWMENAPALAMRFVPATEASLLPAWWLGFAPYSTPP